MSNERKRAGETPRYISYLLRLWRENDDAQSRGRAKIAGWRASLENPHTGERRGFASLTELFEFLRRQAATKSRVETDGTE